jgi:hypothetical protein
MRILPGNCACCSPPQAQHQQLHPSALDATGPLTTITQSGSVERRCLWDAVLRTMSALQPSVRAPPPSTSQRAQTLWDSTQSHRSPGGIPSVQPASATGRLAAR